MFDSILRSIESVSVFLAQASARPTATERIKDLLGIGLDPKSLTISQIALRAVIVFFAALIMVRLADRRFLAKLSALDAILTFILSSMLARAVNGSAAFIPTLVGGFILVGIHRLMSSAAYRWKWCGALVKGKSIVLVDQGQTCPQNLRATKITEEDLLEEARINGQIENIANIEKAIMERNGKISALPFKDKKP